MIGRSGNAALKKWAKSEWVNLDLTQNTSSVKAFKDFFQRWYEAGLLNINPWDVHFKESDADFPPFLEDKFFQAGIADRAA